VFEEEHLLDRCKAVGEHLVTRLKAIQKKYPVIGEVRALGAMIAVELFENGDSHKPNAAAVAQVVAKARDKGLILLSCGTYGNVLRVLVPLTWRSSKSASPSCKPLGCALIHKNPPLGGFFYVRETVPPISSCLERPPGSKVQVS
jgi:hypothetical protein